MDKKANISALKLLVQEDAFLTTKFPYDLEEYLERFLKGTDFDVDKALDRIKMYYKTSNEYPDWFRISPPIDQKKIIEANIRICLPDTDREGRPIYIVKLGKGEVNLAL
ncbi:unnamed protein product [Ceutorhynchus assimilis]|uniref:CRAL/TRIO N-terminal domain-containing protein n=1 Tax=Ceutorhynchus assimilis TaxID=467358 RepID=A0A9N9QR35_9CUCU|nr:unnamed protein product [Ceutorhynchus assimilis]